MKPETLNAQDKQGCTAQYCAMRTSAKSVLKKLGEHSVLPVAPKPLSPRLRMPPPPRRSCRKVAAPAPAQATALQTSFEPIRKVAAPAPAPMAEAKPAEEKKYVSTDAVISAACNPGTEIMSESASVHEAFDYVERATAEMLAESVVSSAAEAKAAKDKKEAATDAVISGAGSPSELASEAASGSAGQTADYVARSTAQIIAESVVSTTPRETTGTIYSVGTFDDVAARVGSRTGSDASDTSGKVKYTVVKGV